MDCAASGNPAPNISWIKDGITVGKGDHLSLVVNRNQSGNYWCVAENGFQTIANASAYLNVLCKYQMVVLSTYLIVYIPVACCKRKPKLSRPTTVYL